MAGEHVPRMFITERSLPNRNPAHRERRSLTVALRILKAFLVVHIGLLSSCDEFPQDPDLTVTIMQPQDTPWPDQIFAQDEATLRLMLTDEADRPISGARVAWSLSDSTIAQVVANVPESDAQGEDSLAAQVTARFIAHRRGKVEVSVTLQHRGVVRLSHSDSIQVMERWVSVSAGADHSCGITWSADAYCWGSGLLGNASSAGSFRPVAVFGGFKFKTISAGVGHTCGILIDGRVFCWGRNRSGAVGNGSRADRLTPVPIDLGRTFLSAAVGEMEHACGVTIDQQGFCWGNNTSRQLGDAALDLNGEPDPPFESCDLFGSLQCSPIPRPIRTGDLRVVGEFDTIQVSAVAPGFIHTCATLMSGDPICWGTGSEILGSSTFMTSPEPVPISSPVQFASLNSGTVHACGLTSDGSAYCWGSNSLGQLGNPSVQTSAEPVPVLGSLVFSELEAAWANTCGITTDGTAFCWGWSDFGQVAGKFQPVIGTPLQIQLQGETAIQSISIGEFHGCGVTLRGAAYCWGVDREGRIGSGVMLGDTIVLPQRVAEPD